MSNSACNEEIILLRHSEVDEEKNDTKKVDKNVLSRLYTIFLMK